VTWVRAVPRLVTQFAERHVVLFILASIVFWSLLSPLALVWFALYLVDRYRSLDTSPDAKRQRRVARLLRWYPPEWRARYGDEMATLLDDLIVNGRGGRRLSWNMAWEGIATRVSAPARRQLVAGACLGLCWIPLVPQGLVAAGFKTFDVSSRSWFVALYAPSAAQWPLIALMITVGLVMLGTGIALVRRPAAPVAC
jgi:hypothetical protein